MSTVGRSPHRVAGRARELELLAQALDEAADGVPQAFVVRGEVGVGKTRLVGAVCDRARELGLAVLWGTCVRFGTIESTFLPWVTAVERWLQSAAESERQWVLSEVPQAAQLLPSLGSASGTDAGRLMHVLKSLIRSIGSRRPAVLVMDDVQWADPASRDALTYLLAGLANERLLVLATVRDEGVSADDPVHGWLADLRRLPAVTELPLARLDLTETAEQVALLLEAAPASSLVQAVYDRTGGNPYLVELLCHDLDATSRTLPAGMQEDLSRALLDVWYRLPGPAREAARILAVAGRPVPLTRFEQAHAAADGSAATSVRAAVAEAIGAGVLVRPDATAIWFRHPLLADVLRSTYLPGEAAPIHAVWADQLAGLTAEGLEEVRRLGDLALHYEGAGQLDACVNGSLAAADAAHELRMWREEEEHVQRALRLWPDVDAQLIGKHDLAGLHERAGRAGGRVGHTESAMRHFEHALSIVEAAGDVLRAGRYRIELLTGIFDVEWDPDDAVRGARGIVALTEAFPDSGEHAEAWASLGDCLSWTRDHDGAVAAAERSLSIAKRSGSPRAMCLAHRAWHWACGQGDEADLWHVRECMRWARESEELELISMAFGARSNYFEISGRLREFADSVTEEVRFDLDQGILVRAVWYCGVLSEVLAELGRFDDAETAAIDGLGFVGDYEGSVYVRLGAGTLAVRRGDLDTAFLHFARAREQSPTLETRLGMEASPRLAEHLIALDRPEQALALVERCLPIQAHDQGHVELLMQMAARACADLTAASRDHGDSAQAVLMQRRLDALVRLRQEIAPPEAVDPVSRARQALFQAETERVHNRATAEAWRLAVDQARAAELGWETAVAEYRYAEALWRSGASRSDIAEPLRKAYQFATKQRAVPLSRDVESLALSARVSLSEPRERDIVRHPANRLTPLTPREREVLGHLVAGRTYAEIATALFISEKTVSVHVSNMLRKTGTSSSRDVVALALRLGEVDAN